MIFLYSYLYLPFLSGRVSATTPRSESTLGLIIDIIYNMERKDNRGYTIGFNRGLISKSKKNVIRGIHKSPYGKNITVLSGKAIDYIIDLTKEKITYKKILLDSETNNYVYIPPDFGHLFISLEDDTIVFYQFEGQYIPEKEVNIHYRDPYIGLDIPWDNDYILSDKDISSDFIKPIDYIILGSSGFLGNEMVNVLNKQGKHFITLNTRLENYILLEEQLKIYNPKYVICAVGISGKPTIAWCEDNKKITFKTNVIDTLKLCELTDKLNIHLTLFRSGGVFKGEYDEDGRQILTEYDESSNEGRNSDKYYLKCKNILEESLGIYKNILYLRMHCPMLLNYHDKCFMSKLLTRLNSIYDQRINITFISNLFPLITFLLETNVIGILNFVNPGSIKLSTILEFYKKNTDSSIEYNITKANTCYGLLSTKKLEELLKDKGLCNINDLLI